MSIRWFLLSVALTSAALSRGEAFADVPSDHAVLRIALRPQVTVTERIVTVGDLATITGGTPAARSRAAALDLFELDDAQPEASITQTLVQARLLLAGFARDSVRIEGAAVSHIVLHGSRDAEQRVLDRVRQVVATHRALPVEEVVVQLAQPLSDDLLDLVAATPDESLAVRVASGSTSGRTRIELWTTDVRGARRVTPATVDVRFRQLVPVAARPLAARQPLTPGDVVLDEREVVQRAVWLNLDDLAGKAVRRPVSPGEILTERDLVPAAAESAPVVIKPRDVVRLTARTGRLILVVPTAEALQAGRQGELIRVRNPTSGRIVVGRVIGPGEVEVPL